MKRVFEKYLQLYKMGFEEIWSDPWKVFIWIIVGASSSFVLAYTWIIVSDGKEYIGTLKTKQVISYYFSIFILYYFIGGIFRHFIAQDIFTGKFSNDLVKPVFPYAKYFTNQLAYKTFGLTTALPILLVFNLIFKKYIEFNLNFTNLFLTIFVSFFSAILFSMFEFIVGNLTHWLSTINGIDRVYWLMLSLFGGFLAPLPLLPKWIVATSAFLPFKYVFSFPLSVLQGRISRLELLTQFSFQIIWILVFFLICRIIYIKGLRQYESYGN